VSWIELLPDDLLHQRPGLLRVYAWALTTVGRIDHAEQTMNRVCDRYHALGSGEDSQEGRERDAELAAVNARIAAYRGDHRATIVHGKRALELLDPMRHGRVYGDVVLSVGFAERAVGNTETAADAFAEAARLGRLHRNVQAARWGVRYQAATRMAQGRLHEAEAIVDEDLERVRQQSADPGSMLSALLITKAEILLERNRVAEARPFLEQAIPLVQTVGDAKMLMNAYVAMGMLSQAEGNEVAAREKMRLSEEVFPNANRGARVALLALMQGNVAEAQRWARFSGFSVDDEADPLRGEHEQSIFARICAFTDPTPAALGLVERLVQDAEAGGRYGRAIELLNVQAVALARTGDQAQARRSLCRALFHARHEGFVRSFLDMGPEMRVLLRDLARERAGIEESTRLYALELVAQFSGDSMTAPAAAPGLDEALTARQLEILELLAAGQSNRDIANQLYIAEGTVKAHMHQLFGKLMARNRTEAVANARELHLIA
jgi:LuxR family maltose regulon positive regulatory protein